MTTAAAKGAMTKDFCPNLFILGAAKCGTTTLHAYLAEMPDVCMSQPKEPFFFEAEYRRGLEYYQQKYFAHWRGQAVIGEARHRNLYLPFVPARIHAVNPQARLMVMVRNPVERAYSHWNHLRFHGHEKLSFREAVEEDLARIERGLRHETPEEVAAYERAVLQPPEGIGLYRTLVDSGYYYEQIQRYVALFGAERLKVILLEDLKREPERVLGEVLSFLQLDPRRNAPKRVVHENPARPPSAKGTFAYRRWRWGVSLRKRGWDRRLPLGMWRGLRLFFEPKGQEQKLDPDTRRWLAEHYAPHNARLGAMLGRDLSHWK